MIPTVRVTGLNHTYSTAGRSGRRALSDLSFNVLPGEVFGVLGPNGGGKTTLFKILSTALFPSAGRVAIDGFDLFTDPDEVRTRLGVVFQSPSLDKKLTVLENMRHQGRLYGCVGSVFRERSNDLLAQLGLTDRAGDFVETLSGGLQRRAEIAKSLLHRPPVLLLDEPTTGLDPGARRDVWTYLHALKSEGITVLVTTHLMEEAERCDRLLVLDRGERVALGTPAQLKEKIQGDVVSIVSPRPGDLAEGLQKKFSVNAVVHDGGVRFERDHGHTLIGPLMEAFPDWVTSVSVGKPTLEDVFLRVTGHRFWNEKEWPRPVEKAIVPPASLPAPDDSDLLIRPPRPQVEWTQWASRFCSATGTLVHREIIRFLRQKNRVIGALLTPLLFWFFLGAGLGGSYTVPLGTGAGADYLSFFLPGTMALVCLFTAIFSSMSIIEDRQAGFLQGVLVSPAPRSAIVVGKTLGGAALAFFQSLLFLLLVPFLSVDLSGGAVVCVALTLLLISVALTGFGLLLAWRTDSIQGYHAIMNLVLMPLWFLSGAVFPVANAPDWLRAAMVLNPLRYGVALLHQAFFKGYPGPSMLNSVVVLLLFSGLAFGASLRRVSRLGRAP